MKKKNFYNLSFTKGIFAVAIIAALIALTALVFNLLKLFGLSTLPPFEPLVDIISLFLSVLIIGAVIFSMTCSGFTIGEDKLSFRLSIFSLVVPYDNVLLLRKDVKTKLLLLYYNDIKPDKPENIRYIVVGISDDKKEEFILKIREKNRRAIYELFDKDKETKENDN
jgi:hypothetical protein